jgi:hypothetical protein
MENWAIALIIAGGIFNLGFAVFHITFWKVFRWKKELANVSRLNSGIFQIINLCLTFILFFMAYVSFFHINDLMTTALGMAVLIGFALFWLLRMVEQIIFFSLKNRTSVIFTILFLLGCLLYTTAAILVMG